MLAIVIVLIWFQKILMTGGYLVILKCMECGTELLLITECLLAVFGVAEQMVVQLISYINLVQVVHTLLNGMLKRIRLLVGVFGPYCSRDRGIERKSEKAAVREPCQVSI